MFSTLAVLHRPISSQAVISAAATSVSVQSVATIIDADIGSPAVVSSDNQHLDITAAPAKFADSGI